MGKIEKMKFSEFCDMAENTEQEQQLFELLEKDGIKMLDDKLPKLQRIPILGKTITAIVALAKCKNIAEFRQSKEYRNLMNWNFDINFDTGSLSVSPSDIHYKKIKKILAVVGVSIAVLLICRKLCCSKKRRR